MTITRSDLAATIAEAGDLTLVQARAVLDAILDGIIESLQRDEGVEVRGFGSMRIRVRGPRLGRNPKTGAAVNVPSKKVVFFKPGKHLRETLLEWDE